ncbi:MAG: PCP reductase family protein [Nitrospinota bacterium]
MKFLCVLCNEPMRLDGVDGPHEGSVTVFFRCPECAHQIALLTNPWETQLVKSLGVQVGGRKDPAAPLEQVRTHLADQGGAGDAPACPFSALVAEAEARQERGPSTSTSGLWTPEAEARLQRAPAFVRPMARQAIETFAKERGYERITEAVVEEARSQVGM